MSEHKIGTYGWWRNTKFLGVYGICDTVLRLLEQGVVNRRDARQMIEFFFALVGRGSSEWEPDGVPPEPIPVSWDRLDWSAETPNDKLMAIAAVYNNWANEHNCCYFMASRPMQQIGRILGVPF